MKLSMKNSLEESKRVRMSHTAWITDLHAPYRDEGRMALKHPAVNPDSLRVLVPMIMPLVVQKYDHL